MNNYQKMRKQFAPNHWQANVVIYSIFILWAAIAYGATWGVLWLLAGDVVRWWHVFAIWPLAYFLTSISRFMWDFFFKHGFHEEMEKELQTTHKN